MKVGDKVVLLDNVYNNDDDDDDLMSPGRTGVVVRVGIHGSYISVRLDGEPVEGEQDWTFLPEELELV